MGVNLLNSWLLVVVVVVHSIAIQHHLLIWAEHIETTVPSMFQDVNCNVLV